ncbi:hypothetical protein ACJMK2_012809 [Sinanodonta woodiana]|uniref:Uncharacterized protein n=1 Tax=Sinanodonta woodiana TaxID=1069815 RepID=A0ABD3V9E4_SINWO
MVSMSSMLQSPIQALVKPAMWLPFLRKCHSYSETWKIDASPDEFTTSVLNALRCLIEMDDVGSYYDVHTVETEDGFIRIFVLTWAEWLDVIEIKRTGNKVKVSSFSTGLLPLCIPFACLLNCVFFWVPFFDFGFNKTRLEKLREAMSPGILCK